MQYCGAVGDLRMCDTRRIGLSPMRPPLQWTIDPIDFSDGLDERYATYYADFGRGR